MIDKSCTALEHSIKEIQESFNMLNGTNPTLNFDMALISTQVKILLYIVGLKAGKSSDPNMSTGDGVGHIPGHWKVNKELAIGGGCGIYDNLKFIGNGTDLES